MTLSLRNSSSSFDRGFVRFVASMAGNSRSDAFVTQKGDEMGPTRGVVKTAATAVDDGTIL